MKCVLRVIKYKFARAIKYNVCTLLYVCVRWGRLMELRVAGARTARLDFRCERVYE